MKLVRRAASALACALLLGTACSDLGDPIAPGSQPNFAPQENRAGGIAKRAAITRVSPVTGPGSVSAMIGPEGGTLKARGVELTIPAGALTRPTRIQMVVPGGPFVRVKLFPHGLQFQQPARLGFDIAGTTAATDTDLIGVYFNGAISADGLIEADEIFEADVVDGQVQFWIEHFSDYAPTYGNPPGTGRGGGHTPAGG
ncbi:MAG TPA: hypothetical protein VNZ57_02500 [Longimicrobiales bacterium]|nr:hypothetical protein [Longimicrobiales bacterium]